MLTHVAATWTCIHSRRRVCCLVGFVIGLFLPGVGCGDSNASERFEYHRPCMGTEFRLVFYGDDVTSSDRAAEAAYSRIEEIDALLSHYRPQSELSRLGGESSRIAPTEPVAVSNDLWTVLVAADRISRASQGAFDVTVGPYVRLWKRSAYLRTLPTAARLAEARERVGYDKLVLDCRLRTVRLLAPGMRLDLGGIAKGYAVDQALAVLRDQGIASALVDGGGDIAVGEPPPGGDHWRIGLAGGGRRGPPQTLGLTARAVATSGADYRYVEIDGKRYSHIIDPATGLGLTHWLTVSVVAADCMTADALASAVSVLGIERGLALVTTFPGAEVRIVDARGTEDAVHASSGFPPLEPAARRQTVEPGTGELLKARQSSRMGNTREQRR
jgi:thiamine biosynthesis lipoprotein